MSQGSLNSNINASLLDKQQLLEFIQSADLSDFADLNYDWENNTLNTKSDAYRVLSDHELVDLSEGKAGLTRIGRLFLSRVLLQFPPVEIGKSDFDGSYVLEKRLRVGKNSAIYLAKHKLLGNKVIAKILRPGASENIVDSLKVMSELQATSRIVRPIDIFPLNRTDALGQNVELNCLIYPVIPGISLREFLSRESYHLNSHVAMSFVRQVGAELADLESLGAYHGDLHDENILVEEGHDGQLTFHLIDVSFGAMGSLSPEECRNSDLSNFRQHVWRILSLQKSFIPRMSLRKFLGTSQFRKLDKILSGAVTSFSEVMILAEDDSQKQLFEDEKSAFRNEKFGRPTTFRLQRYEEIIDPSEAARLFVPFGELMSKITDFSNTYVSGNRGSGKSTYLAALGFFPRSESSHVDYRDIFGVYFPCRQGEFKSLKGHADWSDDEVCSFTTRLIVVKTIRRTLEAISQGTRVGRIETPLGLHRLRNFLNRFVPSPGIVSVESDLLPEIKNFASTMVRVEMELLSGVNSPNYRDHPQAGPASLIEFFEVVRGTFPEMSATRFHLLFDDAGLPNLSPNVQKVLCDLILTSNPVYCIKFSAEKFTFEFESSFGKVPENGHDYFEQDISQTLFVGSRNARLPRQDLEKYFRRIVEQRLEYFHYQSHDIVSYLGDNPNISDQLIGLLAAGRRDARYAGWTAVWNIAERTPRNLLELVSEIFAYAEVDINTHPETIKPATQDKAIRTISHKRLQSLSQVAGYVIIGGRKVSLGRKLYEITASIGSIFRAYLKEERGKKRKRQHLALERNDSNDLTTEASIILEKLISFGVLDDTKSEYARDDGVLKPIYVLNRIYCPAFNIIYRRDDHLRLSRNKFELLLLDPESFIKDGTRRLAALQKDHLFDEGLFGYDIYE